MPAIHQWLFGPFCLDMATVRLWDGETPVALPPKAFDVLHYLVTHPERLVTKDELLDAVWPDTAVTDAVVRVTIGAVRKALGETAQTPRYIATVPRRGYRFLATVTLGELSVRPTPEASLRLPVPALHPQEAGLLLPDGPASQIVTRAQVVSPAPATPGPIAVSHVESPTSLGPQGPSSLSTLGGPWWRLACWSERWAPTGWTGTS